MPSMTPKLVLSSDDARSALLTGLTVVAEVVGSTLGPRGKCVIIDQGPFREPRSSRDGVTVAKSLALANSFANLGAQLLISVARKAADAAGDGTTTATVLAHCLFREGSRLVAAGVNPASLKRGIDAAISLICGEKDEQGKYVGGLLSALTIPVTDAATLTQIAAISANSDLALGAMIADATAQVGKDGTVTVEESKSTETTLEVVEGMQFNQGYLSPYFVTDLERQEANLEAGSDGGDDWVYLYLNSGRLSYHTDIIPIAEQVKRKGGTLLVVAEDVDGGALAFLAVNKMQGMFKSVAVKSPGFGDRRRQLLDDLAILTGATVITPELGLKPDSITLPLLGRARRVTVTKDDTTVVGGQGDVAVIAARLADLRDQIARATSDFDREKLQERLAKLTGGVAVVKVGGQTEAEMKERKDRAEDAMYATRAAQAEGIVPGGGATLIRITALPEFQSFLNSPDMDSDERAGWKLVRQAAEEPLRRIVSNAGGEGGEVVAELRRQLADGRGAGWGYNAATEKFEDLLKSGVIDPARVTRTALQSAGSIAGLLLTTEALVTDDLESMEKVRKAQAQGQGMMQPGY